MPGIADLNLNLNVGVVLLLVSFLLGIAIIRDDLGGDGPDGFT